MSNVYRLVDREDRMAEVWAEACAWLARIERGLTAQETCELRAWLGANPRHAPALIESAGLWDRMDSLSCLADLFPRPAAPRARRRNLVMALAASVLAVVAVTLLMPVKEDAKPDVTAARGYHQLLETMIGEHSTMRLPDGSVLTLNTNSRVLAVFDDNTRTLRLERGEVYVKVAHDRKRPLTVWAGDKVVRAVGTAFNVEITEREQVEVIVTEGKVLIGVLKTDATPAQAARLDKAAIPVAAGQRILLDGRSQTVEAIDAEQIDVKLSWREGNIVFHDEPLAQALGEIQRYTRVEFIIQDEELKTIRVAGLFKAGDVEGLLQTLRQNFNISYERIGAEKILLKGE